MTTAIAIDDQLSLSGALALLEETGVRFSITEGLFLPDDLSFDDYERVGSILGKLRDWTAWALGQWLLFGEGRYGDRYAQAAAATGRAESTLVDYARVAGKVPPGKRNPALSFSHHRAVANLEPKQQTEWLEKAQRNNWSVAEMRGKMAAIERGNTPPITEPFVDEKRVVALGKRIAKAASNLGDGRYAIDGELVVQLRAACGVGE